MFVKKKTNHKGKEKAKVIENGDGILGRKKVSFFSGHPVGDCLICGIKLVSKKFQIHHFNKEHQNDRIFNCKDCNYATNYLPNLNTHVSAMHEKKVRQCSHCSFNTTWNTSFHEHMRFAHAFFKKKLKPSDENKSQPVLCDDCGFSTFSQKQFNAHKLVNCQSQSIIQYVSNEAAKYPCDQCNYKTTQKGHLKRHIQSIHEGVKFPCDQCKYKATFKGNLLLHKRAIHESIKYFNKYPCDQCDYKTTRKQQLLKHIKSRHNLY